jgi:hypothetical protein
MNTLLDTPTPVPDVVSWRAVPVRRLTATDRLALRVGLALVLWARRPLLPDREVLQLRAQQVRDDSARRDAAVRAARLLLPQR